MERGFRRDAREHVDDSMEARRRTLTGSDGMQPLSRVASLLIAIARNNSYEGRDPHSIPDGLNAGFVADLLGFDIDALGAYLAQLRKLGLLEQNPSTGLRIRNLDALEELADAG
jgi:hypothetical protein